jgi:hypothetical protein
MQQPDRPSKPSPILLIVILTGTALLALVLYWPTLHLPVIYDDLLHIRITKGLDLLSVWLPTQAFGFYRPLTFAPLLIIEDLFGNYPATLLHGLNVLQHALNVVLLGLLSWRLWQRLHWTLAATLLLALFPFSYQAIAVYGHNVHPTTTGILLLALNTYLSAITRPGRNVLWWLLTAGLFVLALLSHESAVLFGALAALVHWNARGSLPTISRQHLGSDMRHTMSRPWFIFLVAGGLYVIGYRLLPLTRAPQASFEGAALWYKFLYVAQAAGYPLAWFGRWLPDNPALAAGTVLLALALALGLTIWSARDRNNRLPLLLGWGWWALASLVITLPLETSYLLHGPRLLYLAGAGLALLWPVLLEPIYRLSRFGRLLWALALAAIMLTSWLFVDDRLDAYARLTEPVVEVQRVMDERPAEEGIVLVNLPNWLAPARSQYPIGVELVAMLGSYLFVEELMAENLPDDHPVQAIMVPDLLNDVSYNYGIHEQARADGLAADWAPAGSHVFAVSYGADGPRTRYWGQLALETPAAQPLASFGPYELLAAEAERCLETVKLASSWRAMDEVPATASLFVQLLDQDGRLLTQADGPPLGLRADLLELPAGWQADDLRYLSAVDGRPDRLLVGVYDFASGERYPAAGTDGLPLTDNALVITLSDCRS